jgi:hypothetical protein
LFILDEKCTTESINLTLVKCLVSGTRKDLEDLINSGIFSNMYVWIKKIPASIFLNFIIYLD